MRDSIPADTEWRRSEHQDDGASKRTRRRAIQGRLQDEAKGRRRSAEGHLQEGECEPVRITGGSGRPGTRIRMMHQ
ncbi:hypothetical protein BTK66_07890 [Cronobacter sakazakii]|uniref:Uncharacterized protein n=1 Tax=Cronobacter sakazakii TaxID=28141 RepID=A0AA45C1E4_CROSK|nr:hypothetical protein FZI10_02285 [Cronobacter sakazakii]KAB0868823.1 hypothetical protein FZH98_03930 [Cronobacter sakazakii]KAB1064118.1 hypothetical protein AUN10_04975 [Cronobacter sakazakii]MCI0324738.1 hypothetical protein [Cronobacter sakazakii]PUE79908.1 hypothetical protein C3D71_02265 [Cronobacter sakazakii]